MRTLLSRTIPLTLSLLLPGCASLPAQDPYPAQPVAYSAEELDNLVAPIALYPDALLAHILVAATFPDQVDVAASYVRERGTRNIDDQGWDVSVKAVAYYPPVLKMLARDEDWMLALGQAYAAQSGDVMDAVQRLREMAREQGNLVTTREHRVYDDRGRIVIEPVNPQVIYVPTYDPAIVYVRPIWSLGFHTGYFSFGIGFPIGAWLVYEPDWWGYYGHRVYYHGWYGDGWRYHARRYFGVIPAYYHRPRYSVVNININIFSRRVNYINLDRRHRYVRRTAYFERHDRGGRYGDRDRWDRNDDDRRGPYAGGDDSRGPRGRDNDRIGDRIATFDDYRPDRGGNGADSRDAEPVVRSGFGTIEKRKDNDVPSNGGNNQYRGSRPDVPVFKAPTRSKESKSNGNGSSGSDIRRSRPDVPVFTSQPRPAERSKTNGSIRSQGSEVRSAPRPQAPVYRAPPRVEKNKPGGNTRSTGAELRSAPRPNAPVFRAPQRSVERKAGGGGGAQVSRPAPRSAPSPARVQSGGGGGGGKVKASGGGSTNRSGGGKGRKQ
ncbi:MAG TPA: DUF3300 domain-containing protein [Gemmatimonadaceae bacterium]